MKRAVLLLALVGAVACERASVTAPDSAGPMHAVVDGRSDGNPHFFWLPPLAANPSPTGEFDPGQEPKLLICERNEAAGPQMGGYATCEEGKSVSEFSGGDVSVQQGHYQVQVGVSGLQHGVAYRFQVNVAGIDGPVVLGVADVELVPNSSTAVQNPDVIRVVAASPNLPVKFRIEEGAFCPPGDEHCVSKAIGPDGGVLTTGDGNVLAIAPNAFGFTVNVIMRVVPLDERNPCLGTAYEQSGLCVEIYTEPDIMTLMEMIEEGFQFDLGQVVFGLCEPDHPYSGQFEYWQEHGEGGDPFPLDGSPLPHGVELVCQDGHALGELGRRFPALAKAYLKLVEPWAAPATRFLVKPLYAFDVAGASVRDLRSFFTLVRPTAIDSHDDDLSAPPNATIPVSIKVLSSHNDQPAEDVTVNWEVVAGGGSVVPTSSLTDANGIATVNWTLGPGDWDLNQLRASVGDDHVIINATAAVPRMVHFLSPLGSSSGATNLTGLAITVRICPILGGGCPWTFSSAEVKDSSNPHYLANWDTRNAVPAVAHPAVYRVEVVENGFVIGEALVQVARPNDAVAGIPRIQPGSNLPIKVRIE